VRTAVTSPGSRSTPLVLALVRDGRLACHSLIDERCAGFFALGAAKATGVPAVLACTSGTAAANYLPAVVEAYEAGVPLLVLTADRPPELRDVGAGQAIDQIKLYGRAAKWFVEVGSHEATPKRLRWLRSLACRAVWTTLGDRPGPVHLNLPFRDPLVPPGELPDDATGRCDGAPRLRRSRADVPAAGEALRAGARTMMVAGRLERRPGEEDRGAAAAALAQRLGVPLLADPLSGARRGSTAIAHYDALLREETFTAEVLPDWVLRVGDLPTSKPLRRWLAALPDEVEQVALEPEGVWHDPDGVLARIAPGGELIEAGRTEVGWLRRWRDADEAAGFALDTELRRGLSEPLVGNHQAAGRRGAGRGLLDARARRRGLRAGTRRPTARPGQPGRQRDRRDGLHGAGRRRRPPRPGRAADRRRRPRPRPGRPGRAGPLPPTAHHRPGRQRRRRDLRRPARRCGDRRLRGARGHADRGGLRGGGRHGRDRLPSRGGRRGSASGL
jgi:2-succinyl-5-enolpyruvyl-6-hydroxy-3-cyclohexene-1-carboxylate synthase